MKRKINPLLIFGGLAAAAAVFLAARNKARAAQNLRFEPVDIAIDSEKTKRAFGLRLYYRVKIRLINDEPAPIQVSRVNLAAQTDGRALGNLVSAQGFTVPANGSQVVQLDTSIASFGLVSTILDFIRNRQPVPINIKGFIDTDLGRVTVNYNTTLGGGIFGPTKNINSFIYYGMTFKSFNGNFYPVYKKGKDLYYKDSTLYNPYVYLGPEKDKHTGYTGTLYRPN